MGRGVPPREQRVINIPEGGSGRGGTPKVGQVGRGVPPREQRVINIPEGGSGHTP